MAKMSRLYFVLSSQWWSLNTGVTMSSKQQNKPFIPPIIYGTAWKEDDTQRCVFNALKMGFRGIDTANQRKHYFEEGVGLAIQQLENISF